MPFTLRTRINAGPRDFTRFPSEGEPLGQSLLSLVSDRVQDGKLPRPAALVLRPQEVLQIDLLPVQRSTADTHRFLAACTRLEPDVEAIALVGVLGLRLSPRAEKSVPALVVFVEWPDCRWWSAQRILREQQLVPELPARLRSAEEGWPRPGGLGGWWSRGRVEQLALNVRRNTPTVH
ncbi:MAG: hypothetical protein VX899_19130 [Myxococcota bacterium]|nr:hypothetical protein [Myxococcota bacterium]